MTLNPKLPCLVVNSRSGVATCEVTHTLNRMCVSCAANHDKLSGSLIDQRLMILVRYMVDVDHWKLFQHHFICFAREKKKKTKKEDEEEKHLPLLEGIACFLRMRESFEREKELGPARLSLLNMRGHFD